MDFDAERVIHFRLPTGGGEALTELITNMRANGPGWQWRVDSVNPLGGVIGIFYFDDDKSAKKLAISTSWLNRGDGMGLVGLRCESRVLWELGIFHKLLDMIVMVWPETAGEIDQALGINNEPPGAVEKRGRQKNSGDPDIEWRRQLVRRIKGEHHEWTGTKIADHMWKNYQDEFINRGLGVPSRHTVNNDLKTE